VLLAANSPKAGTNGGHFK